jgi:thiamine biosynthesis lipoprotein
MSVATTPCVSMRAIWGTVVRIEVRDAIDARDLEPLWQWFQRVDDLFSTWRPDSEISRLANGELQLPQTSPEVPVVLDLCERMRVASRGAFDITFAAGCADDLRDRPGRCSIDPTGLVKGWAVDRAGELLAAHGVANFAIDAGGDIVVRGRPAPGAVWRVGIRHPWQRDKSAAVVGLTDAAIATSGDYERGDHVIDPRTSLPASGLTSVTVIGTELARVDAYATAALALGRDGMPWLATLPDVRAIGITDDRRVVKTASFNDLVVR